MGFLDDINFQENEEEEGRSAATRDTERGESNLLIPGTAQFDFSRAPSPSVYTVNSPDNRLIQLPSSAPYSGSSSAASSRSLLSSNSMMAFNGLYEWTPMQRRDLAAHAEDVCRDMDVPADEQKTFIENAQVSQF